MQTSGVKVTQLVRLVSVLVSLGAGAACANGSQEVAGDNSGTDPNASSGQQGASDDDGGGTVLSDDGGSAVKPKNPDAGGIDAVDAAGAADSGGDAGGDSGTKVDASVNDAGCAVVTENLLVNGNLDTGKAPWALSSAGVFDTPPSLKVTPQSGAIAAWLGGAPSANDSFYQAVAMPANATAAHLKGYRWIGTTDIPGADVLSIQTRSSVGAKLDQLATLSPGSSDTKWIAFDYTLPSAHAGQTIQIAFIGTTDSTLNTNFFIDSLALDVTYCKY